MIKLVFVFIMIIHALIHLLGFLKEWKLSNIQQLNHPTIFVLTQNMAKSVGLLWLFTCILFIYISIIFIIRLDWWWIIALPTIIFSQLLIILYWQDAKFGTIANIILLAGCVLSYGSWNFNKMVNMEKSEFITTQVIQKRIINENMIVGLPNIVQKWLRHSGIIGKEMAQTVYLNQKGEMRTAPDANWMTFEAEQFFTTVQPSFLWIVNVKAYPLINLIGRDKYINGKGHMLIKLLSLFKVADSKGKEIDQGSLVRYLAETIWFPSSALNNYISWGAISENKSKATIIYNGTKASGIFTFDNKGDIVSFEAKRYYQRKNGLTLENWFISVDNNGYKEFEGIRIPSKSTVLWKLQEGDFNWLKLEITNLKYNTPKDLNLENSDKKS